MALITAVITNEFRKYHSRHIGQGLVDEDWDPRLKFFKVGEGGWENVGGTPQPRIPDPELEDLDAVVDGTREAPRYPAHSRAVFEKSLVLADFEMVGLSTLKVRCFLDFSEFNADTDNNSPEIWEIGLFCDHPSGSGSLLCAYGTFPKQIKDPTKQLDNVVRITY